MKEELEKKKDKGIKGGREKETEKKERNIYCFFTTLNVEQYKNYSDSRKVTLTAVYGTGHFSLFV